MSDPTALSLLRMQVLAERRRVNEFFDAILAEIDRQLPADDHTRYQRQRNISDWKPYLEGKPV